MINENPNFDFTYLTRYRRNVNSFYNFDPKLSLDKRGFLNSFLRNHLHILPEQRLDFDSATVQLLGFMLEEYEKNKIVVKCQQNDIIKMMKQSALTIGKLTKGNESCQTYFLKRIILYLNTRAVLI